MPYRRRRVTANTGSRLDKYGKYIKYAGNAIDIATKAYGIAKVVASIVNAEKKYYDKSTAIVTSAGVS